MLIPSPGVSTAEFDNCRVGWCVVVSNGVNALVRLRAQILGCVFVHKSCRVVGNLSAIWIACWSDTSHPMYRPANVRIERNAMG